MKRAKEIELYQQIKEVREFGFGIFYFFKGGIIIAEIKDGVFFKPKDSRKTIKAAQEIYGVNYPLIYISNRVNRFYVFPFDWYKFYQDRHVMKHYAIVGKTKSGITSLIFENLFFAKKFNHFNNLDEAVDWALHISKKAH
ncbi:hypothetical protein QSV08_15630 [Maribacter sp. BPC-D8]|uniref:hypothetical protein n=1 Tax=Maribacter sp. BPC-D8 TaxID=3053613 RepID=UPI002B460708|nr:hypothetical protein [Maribacter sp. BPC-D8]WRI28646.1 hypothetical protein QSV08_15630 [Maribacter sp. BPC-D8]